MFIAFLATAHQLSPMNHNNPVHVLTGIIIIIIIVIIIIITSSSTLGLVALSGLNIKIQKSPQ
jgi:hypothetical protein